MGDIFLKTLGWFLLILFPLVFLWFLITDFFGTIRWIGLVAVIMAVPVSAAIALSFLHDKYLAWRYERQMQRLLDWHSLADVLEVSDYHFGYDQGSDWPSIYVKPGRDAPSQGPFLASREDARLWIVRQYIESQHDS